MSHSPCPRAWEAEAIEDGRLDALGAASFARHVAQCEECAREATSMRDLREAFLRVSPRRLSPLEQRRQRAELLRRANDRIVTRRDGPLRPMAWVAAAALVAVVTLVLVGAYGRQAPAPAASLTPVFEVRAIGGASFHDETSGVLGRVVLSSGSLAVHVEHLRAGQSFVVGVPDGELEVRGTRFIVEVEGAHTERVLVTEGVVAVRLAGSPERRLAAGESWTRPPSPPPEGGRELLVDAVNDRALEPDRHRVDGSVAPVRVPRGPSPRTSRKDAVLPAPPSQNEPALPALRATAPGEFAAAMVAFDSGSYLDADERLSAFAARFPSDPRSEDAAFLRAVIATKRSDGAAAVARARDYLRRFPGGLRRAEMERVVNAPW